MLITVIIRLAIIHVMYVYDNGHEGLGEIYERVTVSTMQRLTIKSS